MAGLMLMCPIPDGSNDLSFVCAIGPHLPRLARIAWLLCGDVATADDLLAEVVSRSLVPWRRGGVADPAAYVRRVMVNLLASSFGRSSGLRRNHDRPTERGSRRRRTGRPAG